MSASQREGYDVPTEQSEVEREAIQNQQALVIGIGAYGAGFNPLANAPHDAQAIADGLAREYGFTLLPSGSSMLDGQASRDAIRSAIETSLRQADAVTRWLFYFAGHGLVSAGQGYLLPVDAARDDPRTYLSLQWLLGECRQSACAEALIILDVCYGGRALVQPNDLSDLIPGENTGDRIRQLITSGNPDQPVLDIGGSGHSVFTQSLLEALQGWAGIHEGDSSIRFTRLLDHLVFEVPARLRALDMSAASQQPIGGNLIGNRMKRDFVLTPTVPRLSPETVQGTRSDDPGHRGENLVHLVREAEAHADRRALAVQLATHHLQREPSRLAVLITSSLNYEPATDVRAQAAFALGELRDPSAVEALIAALDDVPDVCRAAAHALGQLGDPRAALPLLDHLRTADDKLFLDLVGAIGAVGDPAVTLTALRESRRRGKLVPFVGPDWPQALTGLPDRVTLARELAQRERIPMSDSLASVAAATMGPGGSRFTFTDFLRRKLDDPRVRPGPFHQELAAPGVPFWIDGAYDGRLSRALNANAIFTGADTQYWKADRPTIVRLVGDISRPDSLLVIEPDYEQLRASEGDRRLLVSFLRQELEGKVVLLLGHDPSSSDFSTLVEYVLNGHLADVRVQPFIVWPAAGPSHEWNGCPIRQIIQEMPAFIPE